MKQKENKDHINKYINGNKNLKYHVNFPRLFTLNETFQIKVQIKFTLTFISDVKRKEADSERPISWFTYTAVLLHG